MKQKLEEKYIFNRSDNGKFIDVAVKISNEGTKIEIVTHSLNNENQKRKNQVIFARPAEERFVDVDVKFKKDNTIVEITMTVEKADNNVPTKEV